MADLHVCYFCGTGPDSSLGEYAVVPAALDPSEDRQQSVVLCPDCRAKLTTVMEPVVNAADDYVAGRPDAGSGDDAAVDADDAAGGPGGPTDPSSSPASSDDSSTGVGATADDDGGPSGREPSAGPGPIGAGSDADSDGDAKYPGSADVSAGRDGDAVSDVDVAADAGAEDDDGVDGGAADSDDGPPPNSGAPRDQPHADDELVGRNNEAYNKTLRLLQNREFPVERHEIEQVAANAYQLDPQEVSDAIDALINKGLLTQEGAQLVRP